MDYCLRPTFFGQFKSLLHELTTMRHNVCAVSAEHMITSTFNTSLRGTDSHGLNLVPHYLRAFDAGRLNKAPSFKEDQISDTKLFVNADRAIGHHAGIHAISRGMEIARKHGISFVNVWNSSHFGAAAYFSLFAADNGFSSFSFTNADPLIKAHGSTSAITGTNPICFVSPGPENKHFCLDMATSQIPWNKVKNHRMSGELLPSNTAFDSDGKPTSIADDAATLSPIGGYKGFGLSLMVDILCGAFGAGKFSYEIPGMYTHDIGKPRGVSHAFIIIDHSDDATAHVSRIGALVDNIKALTPLPDDKPMVPGEPELRIQEIRSSQGIPFLSSVAEQYFQISEEFRQCLSMR